MNDFQEYLLYVWTAFSPINPICSGDGVRIVSTPSLWKETPLGNDNFSAAADT